MFFHQPHSENGQNENSDDGTGHSPFACDNAGQHTAEAVIARRVIDSGMAAFHFYNIRQHLHAQIRRENNGNQPRGDQSEADNPEHIAGVFSGRRLRKTIWHKANGCHQRSCQHWRGGMAPGVGRSFNSVVALLHFHHHHFDGDNGIIDQQAESKNKRAEGDAVKVDTGGFHHHKNNRQRQGDRRRDHNAHAPPHADKTDHHNDQQGGEEFDHELVDRRADIHRLIGDFRQGQPQRHSRIDFCRFGIQRFT